MPADPNSRRDKILADLLVELRKIPKLIEEQNKKLDKIERQGRRVTFENHPYLEPSTPDSDATEETGVI